MENIFIICHHAITTSEPIYIFAFQPSPRSFARSLIIIKWGESVNQNQQTITIELNNIDIELINWSVTQRMESEKRRFSIN